MGCVTWNLAIKELHFPLLEQRPGSSSIGNGWLVGGPSLGAHKRDERRDWAKVPHPRAEWFVPDPIGYLAPMKKYICHAYPFEVHMWRKWTPHLGGWIFQYPLAKLERAIEGCAHKTFLMLFRESHFLRRFLKARIRGRPDLNAIIPV